MQSHEAPCELTLLETIGALERQELTVEQLVTGCLDRIQRLEPAVHAWAIVDSDRALLTARQMDQELHHGRRRGPLHGIPLGLKDTIFTSGLQTEAGSRSMSGYIPSYDATAVVRLKDAGAIVLGKTRAAEFGYRDAPPTRNPWNTTHSPGGSSSGSAAAVAAGMCPVALGTQTGGSTVRPALYNGVVGFVATHGRVSTHGIVPTSWTMDLVGIIARTVDDAALVFQTVAGPDALDVRSLSMPAVDCLALLDHSSRPHLGLVREQFFEHADEESVAHVENALVAMTRAGATVEDVALPAAFFELDKINDLIMSVEAATYHREKFAEHGDKYGPRIRELVERGLVLPATDYARALELRLDIRAQVLPLLRRFDAVITPGTPGTAPSDVNDTGSAVMQRPWTTIGLPALGLPTGLAKNGLPLGIQLVGSPYLEGKLLALGRWCEEVLGVHLQPPMVK